MVQRITSLKQRRQNLVHYRQRAVATSHNAFNFYKKRATQLLAAGYPLTAPTNDFLLALRKFQSRAIATAQTLNTGQPAVPPNVFGRNHLIPPPGPAGDNIYVSHVRRSFTAQQFPLQDQNLFQGSKGSQDVRQQGSVEDDEASLVISPPKKKRGKGKAKAVERSASASLGIEDGSLRRSTRARGKKVSYAESDGSSIQSRELSPSKSEVSTFAANGSERSSSPEKAFEGNTVNSKRGRASEAGTSTSPVANGQSLRSAIGDWQRRSGAGNFDPNETQQQWQGVQQHHAFEPCSSRQASVSPPKPSPYLTALSSFNSHNPVTPDVAQTLEAPSNSAQNATSRKFLVQDDGVRGQTIPPTISQLSSLPFTPRNSTHDRRPHLATFPAVPGYNRAMGIPQSSSSSAKALIAALKQLSEQSTLSRNNSTSLHVHPGPQSSGELYGPVKAPANTVSSSSNQYLINNPALNTLPQIADMHNHEQLQATASPAPPIAGRLYMQGSTSQNGELDMPQFNTPQGPDRSPLLTQSVSMSDIARIIAQNPGHHPSQAAAPSTSTDYQSLRRSLGSNPDLPTPNANQNVIPFDSDPWKRKLSASSPSARPAKAPRLSFPGEQQPSNSFDEFTQNFSHNNVLSTSQNAPVSAVPFLQVDKPAPAPIFSPLGRVYATPQTQQYRSTTEDLGTESEETIVAGSVSVGEALEEAGSWEGLDPNTDWSWMDPFLPHGNTS